MKLTERIYYYPWTNLTDNNCNSYLLTGQVPTLIDPGHVRHLDRLISLIEEDAIDPETIKLIINTHAHPDHFESSLHLIKDGRRLAMHEEEEQFIQTTGKEFFRMMGMTMPDYKIDFYLTDGSFELGDLHINVYHSPGHSPGSLSLYIIDDKALISGDVIFDQGVGRVDFPGCSGDDLKKSIRRLSQLPVNYLLPGHGPIIVGEKENKTNFKMIQDFYFTML